MGPRIPRKKGQPAKSKKHSDLYTDEDPKGTIHGLGFKTPDKASESVSKIKKSSRSHNHKTQAAISMEQRAKVMGKSKAASIYRSFINSQKAKTKEMKEDIDSAVKTLENELMDQKKTDYSSIDKMMRKIAKEEDVTPTQLHVEFKKEHDGKTPDDWIAMYVNETTDPLEELYSLYEAEVMTKPEMRDSEPSTIAGPNTGNYEHPVTQRRNQVDSLIGTGMNPVQAHQNVYGEINTGDIESKAALASTLGRVQEDGNKKAVTIEKEKGSILALDAKLDKVLDQVTRNDLRTPMNQQVPDRQQKPAQEVAEEQEKHIAVNMDGGVGGSWREVDSDEEYDYNEDVAYLQKYGRA